MSNLVLELRQGEVMIVNGAPIRFRTRSRIELTAKARFLFGKQIMPPDQVDSPARRIYFALQSAYIGNETEREGGLESARHFIAEFQAGDDLRSGPPDPRPGAGRGRGRRLLSGAEAGPPDHTARRRRAWENANLSIPTGNSDHHAERQTRHTGL